MFRIFRVLRNQLLLKRKFSQYLLYATGEIILVVIGILIALQINNWNEDRKAFLAENKALVALKNEFEGNIERFQKLCISSDSSRTELMRYWNLITNDTIPIQIKAKASVKESLGVPWGAQNTVLSGLVNSGQIDNIKNDTLKKLLTVWPNHVQVWNTEENRWKDLLDEEIDYYKTRMRRIPPFTSEGKFWLFNSEHYREEWEIQRAMFVNDLEYQNLIASKIRKLYIQSILCDRIMGDYHSIMAALDYEIERRQIKE